MKKLIIAISLAFIFCSASLESYATTSIGSSYSISQRQYDGIKAVKKGKNVTVSTTISVITDDEGNPVEVLYRGKYYRVYVSSNPDYKYEFSTGTGTYCFNF